MSGTIPRTYLQAYARISDYFSAIQRGSAPSRFNQEFVEKLGFKSKSDRALVALLKEIGFIDNSNVPTQVYREYLDKQNGPRVLARQIRIAYEPLMEIEREAFKRNPGELAGKFRTLTNATEQVANLIAQTFVGLCKIADFEGVLPKADPTKDPKKITKPSAPASSPSDGAHQQDGSPEGTTPLSLNYHIEIHLPNTTDVEVFRSIFKALKEHL